MRNMFQDKSYRSVLIKKANKAVSAVIVCLITIDFLCHKMCYFLRYDGTGKRYLVLCIPGID